MELFDVDGSIPYKHLYDSSDTTNITYDSKKYEIDVMEQLVFLETFTKEKQSVHVNEDDASPKCKKVVEISLKNVHTLADEFRQEMREFEKATLFSSKCYKVDVLLVMS